MLPSWTNWRLNGLRPTVDRLDDIKKHLPTLRAIEEAAIDHAASGERDAVIRAGNENADQVTPANLAVKKSLDGLADSFVMLLDKDKADSHAKNRSLNLDHGYDYFSGTEHRNLRCHFSEPRHL